MKVILLRDVAKVGRKGQVCEVPSGYAANLLIPRKLAIPATPESLKQHTAETARHTKEGERAHEAFRDSLKRLQESRVQYVASANAQGHLFKGIHAVDIARRLTELGIALDATTIILSQPIKEIGVHTIPVRYGGIEGVCTLEVVTQY